MKEGLQVGVSEQSSPAYELKRVRLHGLKGKQQAETWDAIVKIAVKTDDDEEFELFSSKNSDSASRRTPDANAWELDTTTGAAQVDGQIGRGVRIAGDMRVLIVEAAPSGLFGKRKKVVEFWMHTSFFEHPPPQMGGVSRKLSPAECTEQGVGEGSTSIMYRWDEIDGVARDTKHKVYDQTFMVELLVQPLGRCGIGHQTRMDMRAEQRPKTVPYQEKKDYQRYCEEMSMLGKETMPFDNWIMKHSRSSIYSLLSSQTMPSEGLTSIDMYKMLENGDGGEMERTESVDARLGFREQKDSVSGQRSREKSSWPLTREKSSRERHPAIFASPNVRSWLPQTLNPQPQTPNPKP
ncbi:hypothetical protein T484DRAFT_3398508 [Baffinella frigidus]|nr:hypothetical protein T484DRAFT_3398508 [Cryptophyta sp. CCMP2293]